MASAVHIPIERLTAGLEIVVPSFGFAEVYGVEFNGEGYVVQYCTDDRYGWDALDTVTIPAGDTVQHAYDHAPPYLRSRAAVTDHEWEVLAEAQALGVAAE